MIKKDMYFSGYIVEGRYGLKIVDLVNGEFIENINGIKWARFNKPKTVNNIGYAIAYLDEYGNGYTKDIPNILDVSKDEIKEKVNELKNNNISQMIVFTYIKPCTYMYGWDYIKKNEFKQY